MDNTSTLWRPVFNQGGGLVGYLATNMEAGNLLKMPRERFLMLAEMDPGLAVRSDPSLKSAGSTRVA